MITLALAVPYSGRNLPPKLQRAFSACTPPMNTNVVMFETTGQPIDVARNFFAEQALAHNCKYIFFWDEDVLLPPHALRELMFIAEHYPRYAVIGGVYCLKTQRPEPLVFRGTGTGPYWDWKVGEVFECTGIGMGCTLIRTEVLKDLPKPWFKTVDNMDPSLDHIPFGEQWTEDLYFCKKVIDAGWKIAAHGQLLCPHLDVNTGKEYMMTPDSKPMREFAMPHGKKKIVDIGCGTNPYRTEEGQTVTVDCREDVGPDYRCDVRKLPFATGSFDIVHSSNVLEHFRRSETSTVLKEWIRVMNPKGELRLLLPDIELAGRMIADGHGNDLVPGTSVTPMDVLYGQQSYAEDFHYNGFTEDTIRHLLNKNGLTSVDVVHKGYELIVRAGNGLDRQPKGKQNSKRKRGN